MMMLKPSDIYFSQDSINNMFDRRCPHNFKSVGGTLDDLCEGRISVSDIPKISVMYKNGKWFTGDNRRLWVFRHLERLGKCTTIPVNETGYIPSNKFTTFNGGVSVSVRRNPGGRWYLKPSQKTPTSDIRRQVDVQHIPSLSSSEIFPSSYHNQRTTRSIFDSFGNFSSESNNRNSTISRQSSASTRPTPVSLFGLRYGLQDVQRPLSNLTTENKNVKYIDPMDCRFLKDSITRYFDNGVSYQTLKRNLELGLVSYRDIPALKVYEAYDMYYVSDGNRRLKAFQEVKDKLNDVKIKVEVIGDEDDLLDELRKTDPAITAFEVMQLGDTVCLS